MMSQKDCGEQNDYEATEPNPLPTELICPFCKVPLKQSTDIPNCLTCTRCPFLFGTYFDERLENPVYETTKSIGCASHPLALQVIAGPAIMKLHDVLTVGIYGESP